MPPDAAQTAKFVELFTRHNRRIYSYVLTLVPRAADADEVYQETSKLLWEKFHTFEPGTNFGAWACRIAYFKAMSFYKQQDKNRLIFDDELLRLICEETKRQQDLTEARQEALSECLRKLGERNRRMIEHRYAPGATVKSVAAEFQTTANAVYKALNRIHRMLLECVNRSVESRVV